LAKGSVFFPERLGFVMKMPIQGHLKANLVFGRREEKGWVTCFEPYGSFKLSKCPSIRTSFLKGFRKPLS